MLPNDRTVFLGNEKFSTFTFVEKGARYGVLGVLRDQRQPTQTKGVLRTTLNL